MQGPGWVENTTRGTTGWRAERGRAERRAWQEGKTEWKACVREGNGMPGQGRAGQHMAGKERHGTAGAGAGAHSAQGRIG